MDGKINLLAIYLTNFLGILMLLTIWMGNHVQFRRKSAENRYLICIAALALLTGIVDPLVYTLDGREGGTVRLLLLLGNSWTYFSYMLCSLCWILFMIRRMNGSVKKKRALYLALPVVFGTAVLLLNFLRPVVFEIDRQNRYARLWGYRIFIFINVGYLLYSIGFYARTKRQGGMLKSFPILVYLFPVVLGTAVQSLWLTASVTNTCIALSGLLSSLQGELLYRDPLTGLYNRYFMSCLQSQMKKRNHRRICGIMLDLNGFKSINDTFGHSVGDQALTDTAELLLALVDGRGNVLRYAGDEFIILLNTGKEEEARRCIGEIEESFSEFNRSRKRPYLLSASSGYCCYEPAKQGLEEFLERVDRKMYEDKREYYAVHPGRERRRKERPAETETKGRPA